jgi:hypothetical protein
MTGIYDRNTGKIIGCKKHSLSWWHEQYHDIFSKSAHGIRIQYWQEQTFVMLVVITGFAFFLDFFKWLILPMMLAHFILEQYEESWCWKFAKRKFK